MLDLYFWTTNNGYRARTMVEETGLAYNLHPVSLLKREQLSDSFRKLHVGHKIPVLVDSDGPGGGQIVVPESPAILRYLATKTNSQLIPKDARALAEMETWFSCGIATFCPILAQHGYFNFRSSEDVPGAKKYYETYALDLYGVINQRLEGRVYFAGDYSLADLAHYADVRQYAGSFRPDDYPNVKKWYDRISARPAVQRAYAPLA
jgi:GSH-dependent disulfide-bond oxidoreductase